MSRQIDQPLMDDIKLDVPTMPNLSFSGYQNMMNQLTSWQHFRNYYIKNNH